MENDKSGNQVLFTAMAVIWCIAVAVAYYGYNIAYYAEKISTFGRFFLNMLEM